MINHVPEMYNLRGQTVTQFGLDCTGQVQYHFNQQGFRSNVDFDQVPKIALFGCSLVFGIGVNDKNITSSQLPNTYNFGLAGNYTNHDIYQTINQYLKSQLYSSMTQMVVVWTDRDQECLLNFLENLKSVSLYHFFCGNVINGDKNFKFISNLDHDVSNTHMGPTSHKLFAKILWALLNQ